MPIKVINNDWKIKIINIKDKTHRILNNGVRIPTALMMDRLAAKIK